MTTVRPALRVGALAQLACLLEASAPKPGNVSPGRHFHDLRYEHFLASAVAIGESFAAVARRPVGETIRAAVDATACWTGANTNLGMILLLAPLARAAADLSESGEAAISTHLRDAVRRTLAATTVQDARDVYAAIRRASPGGLGHVPAQDVATDPDMTLVDVMRLAADRDTVAREYATAFEVTFERGAPALEQARRDGLVWNDAIVETFLRLLADAPDTHIVRRTGVAAADRVSQRARDVLAAGGVRSAAGRRAIEEMDAAIRDERNSRNPGTTADLTAAAIFVTLMNGGWT